MIDFFNVHFSSSSNCGYIVKGGPGVGKSVFGGYFIHRYIVEIKNDEDLWILYWRKKFGFFAAKRERKHWSAYFNNRGDELEGLPADNVFFFGCS